MCTYTTDNAGTAGASPHTQHAPREVFPTLDTLTQLAKTMDKTKTIVVTISGRGDKDCAATARYKEKIFMTSIAEAFNTAANTARETCTSQNRAAENTAAENNAPHKAACRHA